jgi:hypothetical protein
VLSWLIRSRSVDGVRGPATVGFLLVPADLAAYTSSTCLAEAGCLAGGPGERDWMRPSVVRVSADPGDPADLGNDSLPDAVAEHARNDALRSDIFDGFDRRLLPRRSPNMTTDTSTLPRRALVERDDSTTPTRRESPLGTDRRRPAARPPRTKRGGGHLLRLLLPDESRQAASDPLLLLGPNGGPLWTSRTR